MTWRDQLAIHPAAELFPPMSESELRELGEDIKANGLQHVIVLHQGKLIDGRNRLDAMELVGITLDWDDGAARVGPGGCNVLFELVGPTNPYDYVIGANLHRRHLTADQRRDLIAKVLKAKPEASNRQIAKQVKADDKTVAKVRTELESTAEIPQLKATIGKDGKTRKATRPTKGEDVRRIPHVAETRAASPTHAKRTTALDVLEVWMQLPPEEDRRVFNAIGLKRILAGLPESWLPALNEWVEQRRSPPPTIDAKAQALIDQIPDDLSIPRRAEANRVCAQCRGRPDGSERPYPHQGALVWLHPECRRFWLREHPQ